jgi:hypothetical protein
VDVAACNDRAFRFWNKMGFRLVSLDDKGARLMIRFRAGKSLSQDAMVFRKRGKGGSYD